MSLFDFIFGNKKKSLEEADLLNREFLATNPEPKNSEDEQLRNASSLMTSGKFEEALAAYLKMSEEFPEKKGLYESQVGVANFFLGEYKTAIEYYVSALKHGMDKNMIDDNTWEAVEKIYDQTHEAEWLRYYLKVFPTGYYARNASMLLAALE